LAAPHAGNLKLSKKQESLSSSRALSFLKGSGRVTSLVRSFDWANTPVGPIEQWPVSLKMATALLLQSPIAIVMLWGPEGVMIYNDAYSKFAGGRHPGAVGSQGSGSLA
jgi:hypothetical protein